MLQEFCPATLFLEHWPAVLFHGYWILISSSRAIPENFKRLEPRKHCQFSNSRDRNIVQQYCYRNTVQHEERTLQRFLVAAFPPELFPLLRVDEDLQLGEGASPPAHRHSEKSGGFGVEHDILIKSYHWAILLGVIRIKCAGQNNFNPLTHGPRAN